jgi:hypothetical protein
MAVIAMIVKRRLQFWKHDEHDAHGDEEAHAGR